ncbi:MAG: hypothetical protein K2X39_05100 [Silvanigrellaceae bacterium]|nr:hypothetical protein [Silvanigrellaceae bacterium]
MKIFLTNIPILAIGASIAIEEIQNESLNLKLCVKCQEIILKEKNPVGTAEKIVLPKPTERVNKVIKFMQTYTARADVQVAALDAVINFSRNPDAKLFTRETEIVVTVSQILKEYLKEPKVLWRGCMAFAILATISGEIAVDIEFTKIHESLIENYSNYQTEPMLQQQILWLLGSFLMWPRSARQVHKSQKCMDFFKSLIGDKEKELKNQEELKRQKEQEEKVILADEI